MIEIIMTLTLLIIGNLILNSLLLIEYEKDFSVLQKRWARVSFLFMGWVFLGATLIALLCTVLLFAPIEGFKKAFKKDKRIVEGE